MKLSVNSTQIRSFEIEQIKQLIDYQPDIISCYPSVIREILALIKDDLTELKAIKLGGEKIFQSDLKNIFKSFEEIQIIEQLGSTEMPAVATRVFENNGIIPDYNLHYQRFSFFELITDGWHELIVKDNFENQFFPIPEYYNMGDEVLLKDGKLVDIRRQGDLAFPYYQEIENLLDKGCRAVQIITDKKQLLYDGNIDLAKELLINNQIYTCIKKKPDRIMPSNKMKLVCTRL